MNRPLCFTALASLKSMWEDHGIRRKAIQSNWTGPFLCPMRYLEIQGQCAYEGYPWQDIWECPALWVMDPGAHSSCCAHASSSDAHGQQAGLLAVTLLANPHKQLWPALTSITKSFPNWVYCLFGGSHWAKDYCLIKGKFLLTWSIETLTCS